MDENEYALRLADVKTKLEAAEADLRELLDADMTDDQAEHVEDVMARIGHATAIMA